MDVGATILAVSGTIFFFVKGLQEIVRLVDMLLEVKKKLADRKDDKLSRK